ncbi:hypothetical protein A3B18_01645 [Candidatus Giovannonibacteria bacterium RIFCSPLOWO2_01_FULL_46_13]|uniref:Uncharacterized protein n=1 Tax=Candidatus Giovannonibacteria bacterium RIFCSPLOWO2_01_FULL_46_13 TaxID=1798352 RepID=A0A1F5X6E3_9BACT|nr:MAG: hypothetical protein A3B18_01645 [Candidatus Giovannonibacteria bacterium RIFCSPLOWO2_01_FULL_46_13]
MHRRFVLILILLIIVPTLALFWGGCFSQDKYFLWGYECPGSYIYVSNLLGLLGSTLLIYFNLKEKIHSKLWYFLGILFAVIFAIHLFIFYSLSNIALF